MKKILLIITAIMLFACSKDSGQVFMEESEVPMPEVDGVMIAPINAEDVADMLGVTDSIAEYYGSSKADVGFLCSNKHGKINKWSKHKPVWYDGFSTPISEAYKSKYNGYENILDSEYHSDGDCGVAPVASDNYRGTMVQLASLIADISSKTWSYAAPRGYGYIDSRGNQVSSFRLTDFENYYHEAIAPLSLAVYFQNITVSQLTSNTVTYVWNIVEQYDTDINLSLTDIGGSTRINFEQCKVVASLTSYNGTILAVAESDFIIQNGNETNPMVSFNISNLAVATYTVRAALVYNRDDGSRFIYPLPDSLPGLAATFPISLKISNEDPGGGGIYITDVQNDVMVAPGYYYTQDSMYKYYANCFDDGDDLRFAMVSRTRRISIIVKVSNTSNRNYTYQANRFTLTTERATRRVPARIGLPDGSSISATSNVTIPANGSLTLVLSYEDVLSAYTGSGITTYEISMYLENRLLWDGALYQTMNELIDAWVEL